MAKTKLMKFLTVMVVTLGIELTGTGHISVDAATLGKVDNIKMGQNSGSSVTLNWNKENHVTGYQVFIYSTSKKSYRYYGSTKNLSYTIGNLNSASLYRFKVRAYVKDKKGKSSYGPLSGPVTGITDPGKTNSLDDKTNANRSVLLQWKSVSRATGYEIYSYDISKKKYVKVGTTNKTNFTVKGLSPGSEQSFYVQAYKKVGTKKYYGEASKIKESFTRSDKVTELKTKAVSDTSVVITWKNAKGADYYRVYRYDSAKKEFVYLFYAKKNSYTVSNLSQAGTYQFQVRGITAIEGTKYRGEPTTLKVHTKPARPTDLSVKNRTEKTISYEWKKVSKASGYVVKVYSNEDKLLKSINVTSPEYKYTSQSPNVVVKTEVLSYYKAENKKNIYSQSSGKLYANTILPKAKGVVIRDYDDDGINLKWNQVEYAQFYRIYAKGVLRESEEEEDHYDGLSLLEFADKYSGLEAGTYLKKDGYLLIDETKDLSATLKGLDYSYEYDFKICACYELDQIKYEGIISNTAEEITSLLVPEIKIRMTATDHIDLSWNKDTVADGYELYRYDSSKDKYVQVLKSTVNTYKDSSISSFRTYKYKIRAYKVLKDETKISTKFCNETSFFTGSYGIDVSKWQGNIDWNKVKADGVQFAIIRGTMYQKDGIGSTNLIKDPYFEANLSGAKAVGIKVGIYVYSFADTTAEAKAEANVVLGLLENRKLSYPITYDFERPERAKTGYKSTNTAMVKAFCDQILANNYRTNLYTGAYYLSQYLDYNKVAPYGLWVARYLDSGVYGAIDFNQEKNVLKSLMQKGYNYGSTYSFIENAAMWQYTSSGRVDGISGNVDMNFSYINYE